MIDADELASVLDEALVAKREIQPLTKTHGEFDLPTAYVVQARGIELRMKRGEKIVGYKMGLTSEAKRKQMSLGAPIYGVLTDAMQIRGEVRVAGGVHPKIEPEIAFVTAKPLHGRISRDEAHAALQSVAPALEILDSRFAGFKYFSLTDVVADNCSSWRFALGPVSRPKAVDGLRMRMSVDGRVVQETDSNAISGHPLDSLVQLVAMLPHPLPAGSIVLAGAATVAEPLRPGVEISLDVESLGSMKVRAT
ncbi:MAG: 2-keto-4-pentenoate hydratase [Myxococcales bacterium]|nr:fumarylacetoacetate hydrolase family protein [Myxococcales bacterium]